MCISKVLLRNFVYSVLKSSISAENYTIIILPKFFGFFLLSHLYFQIDHLRTSLRMNCCCIVYGKNCKTIDSITDAVTIDSLFSIN